MKSEPARIVMERIDALARVSDEPGRLTRTFCSPAMSRANSLVAGWMREDGLETRFDTVGNLLGHYPGASPQAKTLLLGSHLDTVPDAGKFDGPLGVLIAMACVRRLKEQRTRLPFAINVAGFSDEEGVRYQVPYLGSRAMAGTFDHQDLARMDARGIPMAQAIREIGGDLERIPSEALNPASLIGYVEAHIEQGPVLEKKGLAAGVVSGIAGQTRAELLFRGRAQHAGTTPMTMRADALCAAAELISMVEQQAREHEPLVATIGQLALEPGAGNVIPGEARMSLDVRHPTDSERENACKAFMLMGNVIASKRGINFYWKTVHATSAVYCDPQLSNLLGQAVARHQPERLILHSGAGHDAVALSAITPVAMLFVRCKGGISHHPDELASVEDIGVAVEIMNDFINLLAHEHSTTGTPAK
jgi:allantoate deiminase